MGWVRECITNECCDGADRRLSTGAVDCPIHLCDNGNRDGRADNPANRGEECMLETERSERSVEAGARRAPRPRQVPRC